MPAIGAIEVFVFRQGQFVGSRMFSPDRVVSIGRGFDQGLRLDDEEVSSRHATLRVVDGRLVISDAGSRNGVYVNGRKIQSAKVSSFDEILVGGCRLKIDIVGGQGPEEDIRGGSTLEKTRVGPVPTGPGPTGTQPPRSGATATNVPRMAEPEPDGGNGPSTAPFMRPVAEQPALAPAPAPRDPAPAASRPASTPPAARPSHRAESAPPSFVDEDARTASIEFAPASTAPGAAPASYWDFDEEGVTQPGRAGRDEDSQVSGAGTRPLPGPGVDGGRPSDLVIVDAAAAAPQAAPPPPGATRAREPMAAPSRGGQPFPMFAPAAPAGSAASETAPAVPARVRAPASRPGEPPAEGGTVKAPPPAAPTRTEPTPAPEMDGRPTGTTGVPVEAPISAYAPTPRIDADAVLASETPADGIAGTVDTQETVPPLMAAPRAPLAEDEELEEDEVEERDWIEPFSLLENILRDHPKDAPSSEEPSILEMIRYRERRIMDLVRLHRGEEFISFGASGEETTGRFRLVKLHKDGRAQLFFTDATHGSVVLGGVTTPLADLCVDDRLHDKRRRIFTVMLCEGDYAQILLESGGGFLMRFVRPPAAPAHTFGSELSTQDAIFMGCGVGAILLILAGLWGLQAIAGPAEIKLQEEELTFAQVSLKDAQLQKPDEQKKVETPELQNAEAPMLEKIKVVAHEAPRRHKVAAAASAGPPGPPQPAKPAGVLSALNDMKPAADSGDNALRAAVSNIAAVRVPSGTSSAFQVSGTFSKLPGGEVRLATGGGGGGGKGRETRVGAELFRGEKGAKLGGLTGPAGGGGKVRGAVKSAGKPVTRGGILDAAAVQRVVTQHLAAVQACYERQLLKDPGLQGKITFDWDVAPSGSVASARMVSSTMGTGGSTVAACIVNEIRRWHFPQPVGGTASVRYPFIFRMSGF